MIKDTRGNAYNRYYKEKGMINKKIEYKGFKLFNGCLPGEEPTVSYTIDIDGQYLKGSIEVLVPHNPKGYTINEIVSRINYNLGGSKIPGVTIWEVTDFSKGSRSLDPADGWHY